MTLFAQNRGVPTLSLKGRVCIPLFLFLLVLSQFSITPIFAQDLKNRTEEMHHFGKVIIAKQPLPDKVYQAQKVKFIISVIFIEKETDIILTSSMGTGYLSENPGTIVTVRHILSEPLANMEKMKAERIKTNPKFDYSYLFKGTIITDTAWINFPLSLAAVGETGTSKDIMALSVGVEVMREAHANEDVTKSNPYKVLLKTSDFADAEIGDNVYISGFAPLVAEYPGKNNRNLSVYMDMINFSFPAEVTAKITDMPVNKAGIKMIYRLHDSAEPGFSGGMVLNSNGQIIGMTMSMSQSRNFIYAISSKDIQDFLKNNKLR